MSDLPISFKEMCARFGVTPRTLRYYEYIELLQPLKEGRDRFYGARELARMKLILRGKQFGFSLEEIRQWLELYQSEGSDAQLREFVAMADRQISVLEQQRADLAAALQDLQKVRQEVLAQITG